MIEIKHFKATGKVQGIMFRQTLIRGAQKRGLEAGASNCPENKNQAFFCLKGEKNKIVELLEILSSSIELNSWRCRIDTIEELSLNKELCSYEVTTENVINFNWNPNITFYL